MYLLTTNLFYLILSFLRSKIRTIDIIYLQYVNVEINLHLLQKTNKLITKSNLYNFKIALNLI